MWSAHASPRSFVRVQGRAGGFALPGGGPKGNFARSAEITEELVRHAKSPKFIDRARSLGFSDEAIEAMPAAIRRKRVGEIPVEGWTDAEQILIGRWPLTTSREGRIFHELGHVLDDVANPGLFGRSLQPDFGFGGYLSAEGVAYGMQYGTGSVRGAVLAPLNAAASAYPTTTRVVIYGGGALGVGYGIYQVTR